MTPKMLLLPILLPAVLAVVLLLLPRTLRLLRDLLAVGGAAVLVYYAFVLFGVKDLRYTVPWLGLGIDFDLRLYHFSSFILLALSGFLVLIALYATVKMKGAPRCLSSCRSSQSRCSFRNFSYQDPGWFSLALVI